MAYGSPFNRDPSQQPVGAIGSTPRSVLRRNGIKIMRTRGVVGRRGARSTIRGRR